jgi:hypothetical protein
MSADPRGGGTDEPRLTTLRGRSGTNERREREEAATMAVKLSGNGNKPYLRLDGDLELPGGKALFRGM